jgi:hypothetical protein
MSYNKNQSSSVFGKKATLNTPTLLTKIVRITFSLTFFVFIFIFLFQFKNWEYLNFSNFEILIYFFIIFLLSSFAFLFSLSKWCFWIFKIKQDKDTKELFFSTDEGSHYQIFPIFLTLIFFTLSGFNLKKMIEKYPFPKTLDIIDYRQELKLDKNTVPLYFWDYALFLNQDFLLNYYLEFPYEKGPPHKLLNSVLIKDKKTKNTVISLLGRRPRKIDYQSVIELFKNTKEIKFNLILSNEEKLLLNLMNECGLKQEKEKLSLLLIQEQALIFGSLLQGHFILINQDGSFFPIKIHEKNLTLNFLSKIFISSNARSQVLSRVNFTKTEIEKNLKLLNLEKLEYLLISLITLLPSETEAFFHLGKITKNPALLDSIIQYAYDLKMDPAELTELKSKQKNLKF